MVQPDFVKSSGSLLSGTNAMTVSEHAEYRVAVYACISVLVGMLLVLLVYVACSRRYKLNWFERTVLQTAKEVEEPVLEADLSEVVLEGALATPRSASSQGSSVGKFFDAPQTTTEFWVPPSLQRQASICQSDILDMSGDDSLPATPSTPLGNIVVSPFALQQSPDKNVAMVRYVQPTAGVTSIRPKRTSMHTKLDHTKINAAIYQKPLVKTPSIPEDMKGSIQFTLSYDPHLSLLVVHIIQARDLVARDFSGTADPYAKVRLLPDHKSFRHSRILKKTLNPYFEEDFAFEVAPTEISIRILEILIYDFDQYSRHQCMGCVQLPLDRIDLSEKVTLWKGILPCQEKDEKAELGDIMFSLGYLPSAERLTVVVLKARNLRAVDEAKNTSDVYVKVSVMQNDRRIKKKKTATQRGTLNPVFNEALTFSLSKDSLKSVILEFAVLHDNILGQNDQALGRVLISSETKGEEGEHFRDMLASKTAVARWHSLSDPQ